jgi:hypothetical protein
MYNVQLYMYNLHAYTYHYPSKAPPPLQISNQHPWPSPWERSGGLHISLIFGTASELSAWGIMGIKFCTF